MPEYKAIISISAKELEGNGTAEYTIRAKDLPAARRKAKKIVSNANNPKNGFYKIFYLARIPADEIIKSRHVNCKLLAIHKYNT